MDISTLNLPAVAAQLRVALPAIPAAIAQAAPYPAAPPAHPDTGRNVPPAPGTDSGGLAAGYRDRTARLPEGLAESLASGTPRKPASSRSGASGGTAGEDRTLEGMAEAVRDRVTIGARKPEESGGSLLAYSRYDRLKTTPPLDDGRMILAQADGIRDRVTITGPARPPLTAESVAAPEMQVLVGIRGRAALAYALTP